MTTFFILCDDCGDIGEPPLSFFTLTFCIFSEVIIHKESITVHLIFNSLQGRLENLF